MEGKFDKNRIPVICVLSIVLLIMSIVGALILIKSCGLNFGGATQDEVPTDPVVETTAPVEENTTPTTPDGKEYTLTQDWDELAKINKEIVGWIHVPHTQVNYPVLKHDGDGVGYQYYIHRNYDQSYLFAGSIFIDYRSKQGVDSRNIITHGHNMNNGTMYHDLVNYGEYEGDLKYYKKRPTLFFNTPEGVEQWMIFSVYKTSTLERHGEFFNYLIGDFSSDAQYMNYIYNVKERSLFDVPIPINENDQIITLSTCSYEYTDFRTVVVARKIRPGESVKKYVDATTLNKDALWPDVYYTDYSTKRPDMTTFKTELSKDNIDWYDGKGNLKGNEWLPAVAGRKTFTVTFINYDGTIIDTQMVSHGKAATAPKDPVKPSDDYYDYIFKGWQQDFSNVKANMTVAPKFEPELKEEWR